MSDMTSYCNEEEILTLMEEMQTEIEMKDQTISRLTEYNWKWQEKANSLSKELLQENPKALRKDLQDYKEKWNRENQLRKKAESRAEDALGKKHILSDKLESARNELKQMKKKYIDCRNLCFGSLLYNTFLLLLSMMNYDVFLKDLVSAIQWVDDRVIFIGQGSYEIGCLVASVTERINQNMVATILYWLLLLVITLGIPVLLLLLLYHISKWLFYRYKEYGADMMSLAVTVAMLTFLIFCGGWIKSVLNTNLAIVFILTQWIYLVIRWYVRGCRINRGY